MSGSDQLSSYRGARCWCDLRLGFKRQIPARWRKCRPRPSGKTLRPVCISVTIVGGFPSNIHVVVTAGVGGTDCRFQRPRSFAFDGRPTRSGVRFPLQGRRKNAGSLGAPLKGGQVAGNVEVLVEVVAGADAVIAV